MTPARPPGREATISGGLGDATDAGLREAVLAADAETRDVTWVTLNGKPVAAVIPARNYHDPEECCCQNCPWKGNHREGPRPGNLS